jgi:methionyl-tRNA synthetase
MSDRKLLITSALPYANGPIHIGHLVEYIQTDIWVRYFRLRGRDVVYFCADDTHGTPVMIRAWNENISPEELVARMGEEHRKDFSAFGIEFDHYYSTHSAENRELSVEIYRSLASNGHIIAREIEQAYCPRDEMFLPDRYIRGQCPHCGSPEQYGDSCEVCSRTYAPRDLIDPHCARCGSSPQWRQSTHLFFRLAAFEDQLRAWLRAGRVQEEVIYKLDEWFEVGLKDWDISRDAPYFGFEIPDHPGKYFYVWLDAPVGYMATTLSWCRAQGVDFDTYWRRADEADVIHVIGKDIVYFHALFWPATLMGSGFRTPTELAVHGFLTVNGLKMSKTRGTFINASTYLQFLDPQYLRYYYAAKLTSRVEDLDLNFEEFILRTNSDLVHKLANIPSRTLAIIHRSCGGCLGKLDENGLQLIRRVRSRCDEVGELYRRREFSQAVKVIAELAGEVNSYLQAGEPWLLVKNDPDAAATTCTAALNGFRILATLLRPILPAFADATARMLNLRALTWEGLDEILEERATQPYERLAERVDPKKIEALIQASNESFGQREDIAPPQRAEIDHGEFQFIFAKEAQTLGLTGAYFLICGMENRESDPEFEAIKCEVIESVLPRLSREIIENDVILKGFRVLHDRVHRSNKKNVASPETLLSILLETGRLPHINLLVDIYNLVSLRTHLALGAHDLDRIDGNVTLRLTQGGEGFWPLGTDHRKSVGVGEYSYIDDANDIICHLEVKQVEKTKTTASTKNCFFIVQGNPNTDPIYIRKATEELVALTSRFCGGTVRMLYAPW